VKNILFLSLGILLVTGCSQRPHLRAASPDEIDKIKGTVYFDFGKWVIRKDQEKVVTEKAELLKKHKNVLVILEGHADPIGSNEYNLQLGDRRARNVKLGLVNEGVEPERLVVVSYGESRLKNTDRSPEALQANRRVEFLVK
jgi:outer membrane protein OmpA-like peptidoglycan-associated protein